MIIREFTQADYPALVAIHNSLDIAWPEQPPTPQAWAEVDRRRNPNNPYHRWAAEVDGTVAGFAMCSRGPGAYPPGSFQVNVEVHPAWQRRGIGAALYERMLATVLEYHPPALRADAFTNLPQGFAFLSRRGFFEAFRETPVQLDLATFDPRPYAGLEPHLAEQGILIKTLGELEASPDRDRKLYELYWETDRDMPHEGQGIPRPPFEEWLSWGLHDPGILPDAYFIALEGDKYIGLRELGVYPGADTLMGGLLGVLRQYRQRGIGLALQLRGINYARDHGYRLLKTCTAVQNVPMQALFNKLGYARGPEWQQCQKDLH